MRKNTSEHSSFSKQAISALCHKVKHLLLEDSLKVYSEKFLNKSIEFEYYVNNTSEVEVRVKCLTIFQSQVVEIYWSE